MSQSETRADPGQLQQACDQCSSLQGLTHAKSLASCECSRQDDLYLWCVVGGVLLCRMWQAHANLNLRHMP